VAFQSKVGPGEWLSPSTPEKLEELAEEGHDAVLVIPIAFVTDHIETSYELDIEVREEAEEAGIEHYEVTSGLNCHPLFIESLAEATMAQLILPGQNGQGTPGRDYALRPIKSLPMFKAANRCTRCHQCEHIIEARRWQSAETTVTHYDALTEEDAR
jgi:protoporphyrin/coproporphyrin ferrochelatase